MSKPGSKFDFRDISLGLQMIRSILLGREHKLHGRFLPQLSPRSIPVPDIPRGPVYKYSNQYYCDRSAAESVKPPVVAPVAEGPPLYYDPTKKVTAGGFKPDKLCFGCAPTPGLPWWWDGHCYYEMTPDISPVPCCQPAPPPECPK